MGKNAENIAKAKEATKAMKDEIQKKTKEEKKAIKDASKKC
jgi:hypothetical protein